MRSHRHRAGLSQEDLAERASLSAKAIGALERGRRRAPYRDTVALLGQALNLDETELAFFEGMAARARLRTGIPVAVPQAQLRRDNLPAQVTSFVGREHELEDLARLLGQHRLLTVTGAGGFGKTRLALECAARKRDAYVDGVWLVELASVFDGPSVLAKIASAVGVTYAEHDPSGSLTAALAARNLLLLLDNCEQVLDHVVGIVGAILRACPGIDIMTTSRERLALSAEVTYRIPSLPVPPMDMNLTAAEARTHAAVQLFVERASMADAHFVFTDARAAAVADICRKLEGIALAVEIAAARLPAFGLPNLRRKLDDRLDPLTNVFVDSPLRQRTLHATLEWSYELLGAEERALFRRLSVFAGGCTIEAAREVCGIDEINAAAIPSLLRSLVDKSLLTLEETNDELRYAFLDSTRDFAAQMLEDAGEATRFADHFIAWGAAFGDALRNDRYRVSERAWHARAAADFDNAYAALSAAMQDERDFVAAGRILGGLRVHWHDSGRGAEALRLATSILARLDAKRHASVAADLHLAKANILIGRERLDAVRAARDLLTRARDALGLMHCYMHLTWAYLIVGEPSKAADALGNAWTFAVIAGIENSHVRAPLLYFRGGILERRGDVAGAREVYRAGAEAAKSAGEQVTEARMRASCAEMYFCGGNVLKALSLFEELIDNESWYRALQVYLQLRVAACLIFLGDLEAAEEATRFALGAADEFVPFIVEAIQHLAHIKSLRGAPVVAARLIGYNDRRLNIEGLQRDAFEQKCHEALMISVDSQLHRSDLLAHHADGEKMSLDDAVAEALAP